MFGSARRVPNKEQTAQIISRPAPIGGWNARDALADMPPTDAVALVNLFPTPSRCELRKGFSSFATGFPAAVETIAGYQGATPKLFGCSNGNIYDATAGGAIGAAVVSGLSSNRWQYFNYTTTAGTRYLLMFNGTDKPRYWDGASWITVDNASVPAITGLTTTEISAATSHKSRIWLVRKNTLELYYLPVGAVGGAVSLYDLRPIFKRGGKIVTVETWSADSGSGLDEHLVVLTDQGEVAIYQGTDPTNIATWALVGVYYLGGSPVGNRPVIKFGGDLLILSQIGVLPASKLLQSMVINVSSTVSDKIQDAIGSAIVQYATNFGWQMLYFEPESALVINVPTTAIAFEQYVMNTITGSWCRFTGWNSYCWEIYNDRAYFGAATTIAKAWDNYADNTSNITTSLKAAFDYCGRMGRLKQWVMCRPVLGSDGIPGVALGLNVDFDDSATTGTPTFSIVASSSWDSALWDSGTWGGGALTIQKGWQYLSGLGYAGSLVLSTSSKGIQVQLMAIDYAFEEGGVL